MLRYRPIQASLGYGQENIMFPAEIQVYPVKAELELLSSRKKTVFALFDSVISYKTK